MDRREFIRASAIGIGIGALAIPVVVPLESTKPKLIVCGRMITRLTASTWKFELALKRAERVVRR